MPYKSKADQQAYARRHYDANRDAYKKRSRIHTVAVRKAVRAEVLAYLLAHPCVDCGERNPVVLEFDHRDRATKRGDVSRMVRTGHSRRSVMREVAKCDVRCANCHRIRTVAEKHWFLADSTEDDSVQGLLFK